MLSEIGDKNKTKKRKDKKKDEENSISYFGYLCKKRKTKYLAIDQFYEKFEEKFDIFFYFKKIKSLNLMKKLLLNKQKINFVDNLSEKYLFKFKEEQKSKQFRKNIAKEDKSGLIAIEIYLL